MSLLTVARGLHRKAYRAIFDEDPAGAAAPDWSPKGEYADDIDIINAIAQQAHDTVDRIFTEAFNRIVDKWGIGREGLDKAYMVEVERLAWIEHDAIEAVTGEFRTLPSRRARALTEQTQEAPAVVVHMRQLACNPRSSALARAHALAWWQTIEARHDDEQPALPAGTSVAA